MLTRHIARLGGWRGWTRSAWWEWARNAPRCDIVRSDHATAFTTAVRPPDPGRPLHSPRTAAPLRARVKIDTERVIGDIDPKIYGNFIEHLGRCIDGGVFEESRRSPIATASAATSSMPTKKLNVTQLRWPGGNFSSNYHWTDGIGPRDQRPPRLEMAWGTVESNRFGTHEFLAVRRDGQAPSRTSARTSGPARGPTRSSGSSTATPPKTPR